MFQEKLKVWIEGDARNSFKRISMSQFSVLNKFAAWLDRDAQQRNEADQIGATPTKDDEAFEGLSAEDFGPGPIGENGHLLAAIVDGREQITHAYCAEHWQRLGE